MEELLDALAVIEEDKKNVKDKVRMSSDST